MVGGRNILKNSNMSGINKINSGISKSGIKPPLAALKASDGGTVSKANSSLNVTDIVGDPQS